MNFANFDFTYFRGRVGLYALLKTLGINPGDEVATQALTCLAVPEAIKATGATPLWIDVEPGGVNMDPASLEQKITPQTKAIVVQHTFGIPAEMTAILAIAKAKYLPIIEDCCHTLSSTWNGETVGRLGAGAFYSFEWGKPLVVGIGGAATVNDEALRLPMMEFYNSFNDPPTGRTLRIRLQYLVHKVLMRPTFYWTLKTIYHALGKSRIAESNYNPVGDGQVSEEFGWRMAPFHRKLLTKKLTQQEKFDQAARRNTLVFDDLLTRTGLKKVHRPAEANSVLVRYPIFVKNKEQLLAKAQKANVEMGSWYATPIHPLTEGEWSAVDYTAGSCPVAEKSATQLVSLPVGPRVSGKDLAAIFSLIKDHQTSLS